jgi:hypothetical protein
MSFESMVCAYRRARIPACRDFWTIPGVMKCASDSLVLGASEQEVADILVDKAIKRYTSDNVAVVVISFPWTQRLLQKASETKVTKKKAGFLGMF